MDNLYIDYEQGKNLGNKITNEAKEIQIMLQKINEIQLQLAPVLNNSDDDKYLKDVISRIEVMDKFVEIITQTGNILTNVSEAYQEVADIDIVNGD